MTLHEDLNYALNLSTDILIEMDAMEPDELRQKLEELNDRLDECCGRVGKKEYHSSYIIK